MLFEAPKPPPSVVVVAPCWEIFRNHHDGEFCDILILCEACIFENFSSSSSFVVFLKNLSHNRTRLLKCVYIIKHTNTERERERERNDIVVA